jgi:predicted transposase/invertase (TIGR01784 family)
MPKVGAPTMPSSPHDGLFKATFGRADIARSELELLLPRAVRAHLDLSSLEVRPGSFVDDELQQVHSDLLYAVRTKSGDDALAYVVFEHQSSPDPTMAYRFLRYMVRVWERWLRDHPDARSLPIVLPLLLHHGDGRWKVAQDFHSLLAGDPEFLAAVQPYQPMFRFLLDDLGALTLEELADRSLHALGRLVQLAFWSSRSMERLTQAAPLMRAVAEALERDGRTRELLVQLFAYLWRVAPPDVATADIRSILLEAAGPVGAEDVVNAGQQLIEQGRVEGEREGVRKALRDAIARVLDARAIKLSEVGRARLAASTDAAVLTRWLERAATATTEAVVFTVEAP